MSFIFLKKLPKPEVIKQDYALSEKAAQTKKERDRLVREVITGESDRKSVV